MTNTIQVNRLELLNFYDCRPRDSYGHATAINAIAGEDLGGAILKHYFEKAKGAIEVRTSKPCTQGTKSGKRLDLWMHVRYAGSAQNYQVEIKNWSAHAIAGAKLALDATPDETAKEKIRCWKVEWDSGELKRQTAKVLVPMKNCPWDGPIDPLLCMWAPMHPHGSADPWFAVEPRKAAFPLLKVFSMSAYLRTLTEPILELEMPDTVARIRWLERLFSAQPDGGPPVIDDGDEDCAERSCQMVDARDNLATMAAVPVGKTLAENLRLLLYYAPIKRTFRPHQYLALYTDKVIVAIGKVERIVKADLVNGRIVLKPGEAEITTEEASRILEAINLAPTHGFRIEKDRNFWLFSRFIRTDFRKVSSGGMANKRYFDARKELGLGPSETLPDIDTIAKTLCGHSWK